MPQSPNSTPAPLRNLWVGPSLGVLLGMVLGAVAGLHAVHAHQYFAQGLSSLGWLTILTALYQHLVYGIVLLSAAHLLIVVYGRLTCRCPTWIKTLGCIGVGLGLAAGVLMALNQAAWFPDRRSTPGLVVNLVIPGVFFIWALVQGRRGGLNALAGWIASPRVGRVLGITGLIGLLGVGGLSLAARSQMTPAGPEAPNVVLVTIDTLRYDHVSHNGYERATTPNIDALAAESVRFSQATTPRPKTTPSVISMMTGLYPHNSGVRRLVDRLNPNRATLEEVFKNAGYRTGAIICNYVLNGDHSGLRAGFDHYDDETPEFDGTQRDSAPATDRAIAWLRTHRGGGTGPPVFLWLHYMDPHGPYKPPAPYDTAFISENRGTRFAPRDEIPRASRIGTETDVDFYVDQYDGEILYTDHHLARLLDELDALGMRDDTILVVTSDHGESLGEHDYYFEHGKYVYDNCGRVPLLMRYPGVAAGSRVDAPVELIDLYPTLLDLAGIECPVETDGTSLEPLLAGGLSPRPNVAFLERYTMVKGIRTPDWKVIHTFAEDGAIMRREFYDLRHDPAETNDLYAKGTAKIEELESALYAWTDADPIMALQPGFEGEGEHATEDVLQKLRALGYVE